MTFSPLAGVFSALLAAIVIAIVTEWIDAYWFTEETEESDESA